MRRFQQEPRHLHFLEDPGTHRIPREKVEKWKMYPGPIGPLAGFHTVVGDAIGAMGTDLWELILYVTEERASPGGVTQPKRRSRAECKNERKQEIRGVVGTTR